MNIGVLGGTFNPIHNAHIAIAEEIMARLALAEVLFVPARQPWMKEDSDILGAEHRVRMILLAIADQPDFKLSPIEVERDGPSYTVDTLDELQAQRGAGHELYFILGWDSLAQFPRWKEASRIIKMCRLAAVPRPGYSCPDLSSMEAVIPGLSRRLVLLDKPEVDIVATGIRDRVARGLSISHLVPGAVEEYIRQHKLYLT